MLKCELNENETMEEALERIIEDTFHTKKYEILKEKVKVTLSNEETDCYSEDEDAQIVLPIYDNEDKDFLGYIDYILIYIKDTEIFMETDYIEVEPYLGSARNECFSNAIDKLEDKHLEFLSSKLGIPEDYLFSEINNGSIEAIYSQIVLDIYETCRESSTENKLVEEIICIFNTELMNFYNGNHE